MTPPIIGFLALLDTLLMLPEITVFGTVVQVQRLLVLEINICFKVHADHAQLASDLITQGLTVLVVAHAQLDIDETNLEIVSLTVLSLHAKIMKSKPPMELIALIVDQMQDQTELQDHSVLACFPAHLVNNLMHKEFVPILHVLLIRPETQVVSVDKILHQHAEQTRF